MTIRNILAVLGATFALALGTGAHAAIIDIKPATTTVGIGNQVTLTLVGDFIDEPTIGGGIDVFFDSAALSFVSFEFLDAAIVGDDPDFRRAPDVLDGELNGIGFGNFDGMDGAGPIAVIVFEALATGLTIVDLGINEGGPPDNPGGFFNLDGASQVVGLDGAKVTVVPIPAGFLLLGSALVAVGGLRRRS